MSLRILHYSDLEGVYDDPERVARLVGLIDELRDEETLVLGTGDNTAPGVLSLVSSGGQALEFYETVRPDAETFGNHDFDYGLGRARELVGTSPMPWVSNNVFSEGTHFAADEGAVPWTTLDAGDATVGIVGVTDPATTDMAPAASSLDISDPIAAVGEAVGALHPDVDAIVVCSHLGQLDDELARDFDLDAVLGGHIHIERAETISGTLCTRPGSNGQVLVEVDLDAGTAVHHDVMEGPIHEPTLERFRELREATGLTEVVAHVTDPIERTRDYRLNGECRAGNFIADAYRWAADADLGLHNSGGIRDGPALVGDVRVADLVSLVPFDEPVAVAELTGRELRALFEEAYVAPHGEDKWYAHISGGRVVYDTTRRALRALEIDGESVRDEQTYTVATNAYLLHSRREFPTLTNQHRVRTLDTQYQVLAAYARTVGMDPVIEGRIVLE